MALLEGEMGGGAQLMESVMGPRGLRLVSGPFLSGSAVLLPSGHRELSRPPLRPSPKMFLPLPALTQWGRLAMH